MTKRVVFTIRLQDSTGAEWRADAVEEKIEVQFLEDLEPRTDIRHYIRLEDGRILENAGENRFRDKAGDEIFIFVGRL